MILPSAMSAGEIQLTSSDGTVNMRGEFIAFEDNAYIIGTALGELRVSASRVSCAGDDCPQLEVATADVRIAGSDTVGLGVMPLLLEGYSGALDAAATIGNTSVNGEILASIVAEQGFGDEVATFLVSSTGSSDAFSNLLDKSAKVGMSSRRITPNEARELRDNGAGNMIAPDQEHIIAVDSLIVMAHPSNPITELSTDQLQGIYTGQITNWSEVGGADAPINLVTRASGSATRSVFEQRVFGGDAPSVAANAIIAETSSEASQIVNEDPNAITYVGYAFQRGAKPLTLINECGIRMTPDAFSARTEEYALQRRLYLYNRADNMDPATKGLLDFATSDAADNLIGKAGFIGFGVDRREQSPESARGLMLRDPDADRYEAGFMRDMLDTMVDYDRLSTTFRFRTGSARLDERGRIDMGRLVDYLATQPSGSEVLIVGFTDDVGQFDGNRQLSEVRAAQILQELQTAGGDRISEISLSSVGYGEIAPSGCNISDEGRRINRRVEVWIKNPA
ncbi:phosphate ABC transporter substrate-binding/OmpA family protein [Yoonia sediminilitoris]|nr:phosphate ABC transporter substrate-binding/OmpA family protein [Yoonia sediminilitoris]